MEDIIYVRAASPCPFLFHKDDDEPIFSFAQDFLARKTEEAEASLGSGRNYVQEYLEYHGRYGEAVEQLQGMITKDRTRLELRIRYLVAAIQCLSKGLASSSSDVTLRYQQNADKLKELEDQLDLAKLQERLLIELRSLPQRETLGQEEVRVIEDRCRELDENLLLPNNLFRLTKKYTLWELSLKLIDVCNTSQSDVQNAVEGLWRNMIFNELPTNPRSQALHYLRQARLRHILPKFGRSDVGVYVPDHITDDEVLRLAIESPEGPLRRMAKMLDIGIRGPISPSFPVKFLCRELEELEACVDEGKQMVHRTWQVLLGEGLTYFELFKVYLDILSVDREPINDEGERQRRLGMQLHGLYSLLSILEAWMADLNQGKTMGPRGEPLLDGRQQMFVVRHLQRLNQWPNLSLTETAYSSKRQEAMTALGNMAEAFHKFVYRAARIGY